MNQQNNSADMISITKFYTGVVISVFISLGFGALQRVNGLGWVQLRFHVTLGDAVTQ